MYARRATLTLGTCAGILLFTGLCAAQSREQASTPTLNPAAVRVLDKEAERLQQEFVDSLVKLADGYVQAGDLERAQATLKKILELDPQREKIKSRLEELENRVFSNNEVEVEIDAARGWTATGLKVRKDEPVRFAAGGSYKYIANSTLSPDGVSAEDVSRDMVAGIRLGQLMGVVLPPPKGRQKPKLGEPFPIGSEATFSPEQSGLLFLRLNIPAGTKSIGSVKVTISGNFDR